MDPTFSKDNKPAVPCKKRIITYGDDSCSGFTKKKNLPLIDGLLMLLRRYQRIHKGKLNLSMSLRLLLVKYVTNGKPNSNVTLVVLHGIMM